VPPTYDNPVSWWSFRTNSGRMAHPAPRVQITIGRNLEMQSPIRYINCDEKSITYTASRD